MTVEWSLITRKRRFKPAMLPYLLGRYCILTVLLTFVITSHVNHLLVNCDAMYRSLSLLGSVAAFCSTLNLSLRTYIIWKDMSRGVTWALGLASIGHASLVAVQGSQGVTFNWSSDANACVVVSSSHTAMFAFYLYTILMDLTIVALTVCGLYQQAALDSPIGSSLSEQSLWYCVGTLLCNIPAVLLPGLNLNVVMNVLGSMPGTTFSVVMSSCAVLSLKPEETNAHNTHNEPSTVHGVTMSTSGALTTHIVLESRVNTFEVDIDASSLSSRKSGEENAIGAV
uniref:AAA domain-containing protein n=1 Tax=Ganoderma boninense TaxID=34458 RepID=A0A5K1K0H2_9APHY|nr:AAA domain-containing protein [Ganoderma boninense]